MIASKEYVMKVLASSSVAPLRRYGQNFLIEERIARQIVDLLAAKPEDHVIEIGAGLGALSELLIAKGSHVKLYDLDPNMIAHLCSLWTPSANLEIIEADFLSTTPSLETTYLVIGNLPYYITTPLIEHVVLDFPVKRFVFMVQAEVEERLLAPLGSKKYGPLTIFLALYTDLKRCLRVSRSCFYPMPHVDSVVFQADIKPYEVSRRAFYHFVQMMFRMRRKTIYNNLSQYLQSKERAMTVLKSLNINPNQRPERLTPDDYQRLYRAVS